MKGGGKKNNLSLNFVGGGKEETGRMQEGREGKIERREGGKKRRQGGMLKFSYLRPRDVLNEMESREM